MADFITGACHFYRYNVKNVAEPVKRNAKNVVIKEKSNVKNVVLQAENNVKNVADCRKQCNNDAVYQADSIAMPGGQNAEKKN